MTRLMRSFHTIIRPTASLIAAETPVLVYEANEHAQLKKASGANWDGRLMATDHKAKVFSLIPFFVESAFTSKNFVLQMQFFPKAELMQIDVLRMSGVHTLYVPVTNLIPITRYDYWASSWKFWSKQH